VVCLRAGGVCCLHAGKRALSKLLNSSGLEAPDIRALCYPVTAATNLFLFLFFLVTTKTVLAPPGYLMKHSSCLCPSRRLLCLVARPRWRGSCGWSRSTAVLPPPHGKSLSIYLFLSLCHSRTRSLALSLSLSLARTRARSHSCVRALSLSLTRARSLSVLKIFSCFFLFFFCSRAGGSRSHLTGPSNSNCVKPL